MEMFAGVGLMAGALLFASGEYRKFRTDRRCNQALRRTVCVALAE